MHERYASEIRTEPVAVEIDGDERRRNCEVVDKRENFEEKAQLVRSSKKLDDTHTIRISEQQILRDNAIWFEICKLQML